jgi:hypothetical protein
MSRRVRRGLGRFTSPRSYHRQLYADESLDSVPGGLTPIG